MKQVNQVGVDVDSQQLVCAMQRAGQRLPLDICEHRSGTPEVHSLGDQGRSRGASLS
jgi:hypothetical protein